jgi:phosphatidylethanolamine/phosphatidyl-N-methylethanolamine N-methyltransferase
MLAHGTAVRHHSSGKDARCRGGLVARIRGPRRLNQQDTLVPTSPTLRGSSEREWGHANGVSRLAPVGMERPSTRQLRRKFSSKCGHRNLAAAWRLDAMPTPARPATEEGSPSLKPPRSSPMLQSDTISFFRGWLAAPLRVAALAPSSPALAELMTRDITAASGPVIELGPGTGAFTRALIGRGVEERDLTLIESGADFAGLLKTRFLHARVLQSDAGELRTAALFAGPVAGAVISGLPVLLMPPQKVIAILGGAFRYLKPHGALYQFTYGPWCPVPRRLLDQLGLQATRVGHTLRNIPPATVYRIGRGAAPHPVRG